MDRGADLNYLDHNGETPLHQASSSGAVEKVKLLVDRGADARYITNDLLSMELIGPEIYEILRSPQMPNFR